MDLERFPFDVIIADENLYWYIQGYKASMEEERILGLANDYEDSKWRTDLFCDKVMDYLSLCALSDEERTKCLVSPYSMTGRAVSRLNSCTENSRACNNGEIAEILLYGIMKYYFKAEESIPKIFYKQNSNNLVTGADSIHIVIKDGNFSFWLGEAKFYHNLNQAMNAAIQSVKNMLGRAKLDKEKSYISGIKDLRGSEKLSPYRDEIVNILSAASSVDRFRRKLHIPVLLIFSDEIVGKANELDEELRNKLKCKYIDDAKSFFEKLKIGFDNEAELCRGVKFHLILFSVPDVKAINKKFLDLKNRFKT